MPPADTASHDTEAAQQECSSIVRQKHAMHLLFDAERHTHRSDGIDCLRALLALWVMFSHCSAWSSVTGHGSKIVIAIFKFGVDVFQSHGQTHPAVLAFIVLSGYCIHRHGFRQTEGTVRTYALRRFFRIWPVYILATALGVACFLLSSRHSPKLAQDLAGSSVISVAYLAVTV